MMIINGYGVFVVLGIPVFFRRLNIG